MRVYMTHVKCRETIEEHRERNGQLEEEVRQSQRLEIPLESVQAMRRGQEGHRQDGEGQQKAREDYEIMNEAWWNGLSEEARLAEETRVLEQLEYEITIPDCRNAARRS